MKNWHDSTRQKKNETGCHSVLSYMNENPKKIWWWSWDFVDKTTKNGSYLSHRAPARAIYFPELVEHRRIGRFAVYRLRTENKKT